MDKGLFYLHYWGEIENEDWIAKDLNIIERDFWFNTVEERKIFKQKLQNVATNRKVIIAFAEREGVQVLTRAIASMTYRLNGKDYCCEEDFGYGFPEEGVRYNILEGNGSCDCNRSQRLANTYYPEIKEMECGNNIKLISFQIIRRL